MFVGTDADNNLDKELKGRGNHPKGFVMSKETREKISRKNKGKKISPESRKKMSKSQNLRFSKPEEIEKLKASSKKRWDRYRAEKKRESK